MDRECYVRILSFIEGDIFVDKQSNKTLCKNFAKFLGNLSKSLLNFDHPAAHRKFVLNSNIRQTISLVFRVFSINKIQLTFTQL